MGIIDFKELYTRYFNISKLFSVVQQWNVGAEFSMLAHDRPTNAFLYFSKGSAVFYDKGNRESPVCFAKKGTLVYIPRGSRYIISFSDFEASTTLLLEFLLVDERNEELILSDKIMSVCCDSVRSASVMEELARAYGTPLSSPSLLLSLSYGLFHNISKSVIRHGLAESEFRSIAASIAKIEDSAEHFESVAELASESGMCPVTFNSLFIKYCGMTPGAYRAHLRLERAKALLGGSEQSVSEVAYALGFEDTGYFCRFFKRNTGLTPTAWRKSRGQR